MHRAVDAPPSLMSIVLGAFAEVRGFSITMILDRKPAADTL
jgi:hypothetical protein